MTARPKTPATPCPHYPECAGCDLIGVPYGEQLNRKRERLRSILAEHGLGEVEVPELVTSPRAFGYRTQAKLVVRRAGRKLLVGVYRPGTHRVVDISQCPVHHPLIQQTIAAVRDEIEARELPVYDERTGDGLVRYLVVRVSSWQKRAQLILVTAGRAVPGGRSLAQALRRRVRGLASVVQNVNSDPGNVILSPAFVPWTPEVALTERVGSLHLRSQPGSFLQANVPVARRLYEHACRWADPGEEDLVVDLYCGVGALAFHLARTARRVIGIETSPTAIADAVANVRLNGFHNLRFRRGDVAAEVGKVAKELGRVDIATLNPPRKGADESARRAVVDCQPRRMVYVSCDPSTLARDLSWFREHGYRTGAVQPFDMLPQTSHVETVALLER